MNLSKSRYCKGIQCKKFLWLDENKREVRDDSILNQQILEAGSRVGDLAMGYYSDYIEVPYNDDKSIMIAETQQVLDAKIKTICEASFSFNKSFCSADILRVLDNGFEIIEVKSSTAIKPIYYDDVAYQYYVLTSCGLNVTKVSIMYINKNYKRQDDLDLHRLLNIHDCTEKARSMKEEVAANIVRFRKYTASEDEPAIDIGTHCSDPYDCVYSTYCWRHIPENSLFTIPNKALRFDKKIDLYRRGIVRFEQLLDSNEKFSTAALLQVVTHVYNRPPTIDKEALCSFLETLSWPLYFLDFETFGEAIPPYKGLRPYMQVPFQYSLHIQKSPGAVPEHREFLAEEGRDPRRSLAECLCADIPENICVLTYNMGFEKGRIKELTDFLKKSYPNLASHLMNIHNNIKDLMKPFRSRAYYSKELEGSYSIKKVLPALCPNDPELDYNALDLVHNGIEAQIAYAQLYNASPEEKQRIRAALLAYCCLDTLAMVKILEKLQKICG
ncbi:MAG: DUF2779 domain-containing protein [Spirochaetaceae bacterium]|nr:DUF2779 domain-containing protein [Spirochaetaceae bacterium]